MLPTRDPPQDKRPTQTESERLEQIFQGNGEQKKARVAILISDKIDFKKRSTNTDPEGHFIILKGKNPSRRHKYCKYICTQYKSTQIHKENLGGLQERY